MEGHISDDNQQSSSSLRWEKSFFRYPHGLIGTHIYTTVKGRSGALPPIPERTVFSSGKPVIPDFKFLWDSNQFPFLAFVPLHRPFYGPLFRRLNFITSNVPVTGVPGGYTLDTDLKIELVTLERNLYAVLHAMLERIGPITSSFQFWAFPTRFGYTKIYSSRDAVRIVASRSRDAFVLVIAALSLALGILRRREETGIEWQNSVLKKSGVHPQWLTTLEDSVVGDLAVPRIGCIIDLTSCDHFDLLPVYDKFDMDICVYWGTTKTFSDLHIPSSAVTYLKAKTCFLDNQTVAHLTKATFTSTSPTASSSMTIAPGTTSSALPASSSMITTLGTASSPLSNVVAPQPERYSGQKHGETWANFFARRKTANDKWEQGETAQHKSSRLQREQYAEQGHPPGKKGSRVYVWEDVDGFRIRRAAGRGRYSSIWETYPRSQRKYDSFHDEWDVCTEFGDGNDVSDFEDSEDDAPPHMFQEYTMKTSQSLPHGDEINYDIPTELFPHDEAQYLQRDGEYSSISDLRRVFEPAETEESVQLDATRALDDLAYFRFGYVDPSVPVPPHSSVQLQWKRVREYLGDGHWPVRHYPDPSRHLIEGLTSFFTHLKASRDIDDIPAEFYDVRQETSDVCSAGASVILRKETFDGIPYYLIPTTANAPFQIGLQSAAFVLEVVRREMTSDLFRMCTWLLDAGVPFKTFIRGPRRTQMYPPVEVHYYGGLGYRPQGYVGDVNDYNAYVLCRDHLLSSFAGRASLLAGGIVARLASSAVRYESVYFGPSHDVFDHGSCFCSSQPSTGGYWDDYLTENDTDIICGVYRVSTNQRYGDGEQTRDLSWWPKPSTWASCGLNAGFWSMDCELWFQDRLRKCQNGTADLKTPKEWRHSLRFVQDVPRMAAHNEALAAKALANIFL
ncbi:hypothetical protein H0H93_010595 [Arthromyces matolae]|nr:hypothetical protein H0H93_010595 [Arthromyces matolae]